LGEVALALTAASSKSDQVAIAVALATAGCENFASAWLAAKGVAWAADLLPRMSPEAL
jgi:type IV secretion system protein TrbE